MPLQQVLLRLAIFILGTCSLEGAHVRSFIPCKDYMSISTICSHHWQVLGEFDEACAGFIDPILYGIVQHDHTYQYHAVKVLEEQGNIIGFIIYRGLKLVPYAYELVAIALNPAYQGQGYGAVLLEALKNDLKTRNITTLVSRVKKGYQAALDWHKQQGFFVLGKDKKAQDCFEVAYCYESEAYGYSTMKLALQPLSDKKKNPKNCISSEMRDEITRTLQRINIVNPVQESLTTRVLDAFDLPSDLSFNYLQLKKIIYRYLRFALRRDAVYKYAQVMLGCQSLTEQDTMYLDGLLDTADRYINNPLLRKEIIDSLGIRLEEVNLNLL
jgi:GNAT superfamily N-acetyltransferase